MIELNDNDLRRLAALIARPLKEQGADEGVANLLLNNGLQKFSEAFKAFGVTLTVEQRQRVQELVMSKLG